MKEFGVGMLGFGFIGKVHAFGYRNLSYYFDPPPARVRLVGVCTSRKESAEKARDAGGFEFGTTDFREILSREDVHLVNICTPNDLHRDELLAAMQAGKHIYCDKPLTATWEEAQEVAAALKDYRGVSQMTLNNRFTVPALRAKQMIGEGFLGEVTQFRAGYFHSGSVDPQKPIGWKQQAGAGGGVINDLASHVVDLVDWLVGPVTAVQAESRILYPERPAKEGGTVKVEAEDAVNMLARLADGGTGVIEATKIATGAEDELRVELHGTCGAIRFNSMQPNYLEAYSLADFDRPLGGARGWKRIATVHRYEKPAGWPGPKFATGWMRSHVQCLNNFVAAVADGTPTQPDLARGVRLQYLLEQVRRSAADARWVEIEPEEKG